MEVFSKYSLAGDPHTNLQLDTNAWSPHPLLISLPLLWKNFCLAKEEARAEAAEEVAEAERNPRPIRSLQQTNGKWQMTTNAIVFTPPPPPPPPPPSRGK